MFVFFSNKLGCGGSIAVSVGGTILLILLLRSCADYSTGKPGSREAGKRAFFLSLLLASVFQLASCRGPVQPYEPLAPGVANLRAQFNRDAGTVRIVILPALT